MLIALAKSLLVNSNEMLSGGGHPASIPEGN